MSDLNPNFYCPITCELMKDPVIDSEGNTYEREAIEHWLRSRGTSPITRNPLNRGDLIPNRGLRNAIEDAQRAGAVPERIEAAVPEPPPPPYVPPTPIPALSSFILATSAQKIPDIGDSKSSDEEEFYVMASVFAPEAAHGRVPSDIVLGTSAFFFFSKFLFP